MLMCYRCFGIPDLITVSLDRSVCDDVAATLHMQRHKDDLSDEIIEQHCAPCVSICKFRSGAWRLGSYLESISWCACSCPSSYFFVGFLFDCFYEETPRQDIYLATDQSITQKWYRSYIRESSWNTVREHARGGVIIYKKGTKNTSCKWEDSRCRKAVVCARN